MSNAPLAVAKDCVVSMHYTLKSSDGEVIDTSQGGEPMLYLHGAENIVPGLEDKLTGATVGQRVDAVVPPELGYGVRDEDGLQVVPRHLFPPDADLEEGMEFMTKDEDGEPLPLWIVALDKDTVTIDFNHPLAGEELHFDVTIVDVRAATAEELQHGHPHGADGHHHHD